MRVLVTGGAGFIGSHIVEALLVRGHHPFVVDNLVSGTLQNLPPDVSLFEVDICDAARLVNNTWHFMLASGGYRVWRSGTRMSMDRARVLTGKRGLSPFLPGGC
jgi:nucleoside-diphosphate-sugar epimerase